MKDKNIETVEQYLNALRINDLSVAPIAENVLFDNPITGKGKGKDAIRAFLSGFLPAINGVNVIKHVAEGEYVATHWEVDAVFGIIPILEVFRVRDGLVIETMSFFDPRPILGG